MIHHFPKIALLVGILLSTAFAPAAPPLPLTLYGPVKVNGMNVVADTEVTAWCGGVQAGATLTQMYQGQSVYAMDVNGDDPDVAGKDGCAVAETVSFKIGERDADQTAPWTAGESYELPLTSGTAAGIYLPLILR